MRNARTAAEAKAKLDELIRKGKAEMYKPIQVAEALYHCRIDPAINIMDDRTYWNPSKAWRNEVTRRILNKISTSSARYQDDVWNAMPKDILAALDDHNKVTSGSVERYVYDQVLARFSAITGLAALIADANTETYDASAILAYATTHLKSARDRVFEVLAYAALDAVVKNAGITIRLDQDPSAQATRAEFEDMLRPLAGSLLDGKTVLPRVVRSGRANAADAGVDIWSTLGTVVQVKYLKLDAKWLQEAVDKVADLPMIVICESKEADGMRALRQLTGAQDRIVGVFTADDVISWHRRCLSSELKTTLSEPLLETVREEFEREFPSTTGLVEFLEQRGYASLEEDPAFPSIAI